MQIRLLSEQVRKLVAQSLGVTGMGVLAEVVRNDTDFKLKVEYLWAIQVYYFYAPLILCAARCTGQPDYDQTRIAMLYAVPNDDNLLEFLHPAPSYILSDSNPDPVSEAIKTMNVLQNDRFPVPGAGSVWIAIEVWTQSSHAAFDYYGMYHDGGITPLWDAIKSTIYKLVPFYDDPKLTELINYGPRASE